MLSNCFNSASKLHTAFGASCKLWRSLRFYYFLSSFCFFCFFPVDCFAALFFSLKWNEWIRVSLAAEQRRRSNGLFNQVSHSTHPTSFVGRNHSVSSPWPTTESIDSNKLKKKFAHNFRGAGEGLEWEKNYKTGGRQKNHSIVWNI